VKIAEEGAFKITAGVVEVEANPDSSVRLGEGSLQQLDDGHWRAEVRLAGDEHALEAHDVQVRLTGELCSWSGRGHLKVAGGGRVEITGDEPLIVQPAVGG
jgi:hypothetical protein